MPIRVLAALVALLAILPATASASFDGSTGKVAYVDTDDGLYIDDPFDDQPAQGPLATVSDSKHLALAGASPPAWSPDGTLLAYTAPVDDSYGQKHSAVFVMKADGSGARQVTHPFLLEPDTCDGQCDNGHASYDTQPTWTPDGKIAFIRMVYSGDESPRVGERGTSVRVVDPAGGGAAQRYYLEPRANGLILSIVWPAESIHPFAILGDRPDKAYSIRNLGTNTDIVTKLGILDLDAAPVGQKLAYTSIINGHKVHVIDFAGREIESFATGFEKPQMRFTPDGNSIARTGCARDREQQLHCGIVTHRLEDPDGDVRADDPVETPFLDMQAQVRVPVLPGRRGNFDIQSQDLPVILIPGFLGSEIQCDGDDVWMPTLPPITMRPMALSVDGRTNQNCASAGATGKPVGRFLLADVYAHLDDWLEDLDPAAGGATFGWDWRRAPQESLDELEAKIDELLAESELAQAQGAKRVTLAGHSYGGVLMRLFIDDEARSRKVARTLNVGVPMWGSIKPFFPLTFGIEGIGASALDAFVENEDLKDTMRNFPGAYHLLAGDNFGQWLTVDGQMHGQTGVKGYLQSVGANGALFEDARKTHADHIDGWLDYGGRIDDRAVVGVGLLTTHRVDVDDRSRGGRRRRRGHAGRRRHHRAGVLGPAAPPGRGADGRPDQHPGSLQHRAHGPDQGRGRPGGLQGVPAVRAHAAQAARGRVRAVRRHHRLLEGPADPAGGHGRGLRGRRRGDDARAGAVGGQGRRDRPAGRDEGRDQRQRAGRAEGRRRGSQLLRDRLRQRAARDVRPADRRARGGARRGEPRR